MTKCPRCRCETRPRAKFCARCGRKFYGDLIACGVLLVTFFAAMAAIQTL